MKMTVTFLATMFYLVPGFSQVPDIDISKPQFENQFDEKSLIPKDIKWVLYTIDMDGFNLIKDGLEKKKMNETFFAKKGFLVSDISKMPSLIYRFAAKPKMQEYPFKLALDKDGKLTEKWPREKKKITVLEFENQKLKATSFLSSEEDVTKFLDSL